MDKSNGDKVKIENSFTFGVIGVAVSGQEETISGLAKLLLVDRQPLPDWRKPQILPSEFSGKYNPKAS